MITKMITGKDRNGNTASALITVHQETHKEQSSLIERFMELYIGSKSFTQIPQDKQQEWEENKNPNWIEDLPVEFYVNFRIDMKTPKERILPSGTIKICTDMQWWLGGRFIPESVGTALKLTDTWGNEVSNNPFKYNNII